MSFRKDCYKYYLRNKIDFSLIHEKIDFFCLPKIIFVYKKIGDNMKGDLKDKSIKFKEIKGKFENVCIQFNLLFSKESFQYFSMIE